MGEDIQPVITPPFATTNADGSTRTVQYVELRSIDGSDRVVNLLREDWERWGKPGSIEAFQAGAKERAAAAAAVPAPAAAVEATLRVEPAPAAAVDTASKTVRAKKKAPDSDDA